MDDKKMLTDTFLSSLQQGGPLSFSVASYNILATAYIKPAWYPRTQPEILNPRKRIPALVQHIAALATDIICLQEVDRDTLSALQTGLSPLGYVAHYAPKTGGKPDGCATFIRTKMFALRTVRVITYSDGHNETDNSGHVALVVILQQAGRTLGVANTHLKWEPPGTLGGERRGYREINQLLKERDGIAPNCLGWIICGDLNATLESEIVGALQKAEFDYAHRSFPGMRTCNSNNRAKLVDYLFHTPSLRAEPRSIQIIEDHTPLPSSEQPSDHLAIVSQFHWAMT